MTKETWNCQNCKQNFVIEPADFAFYDKMKVPPPTWCPECRFKRRLMHINERHLYRGACSMCGMNVITMYHPESDVVVYCNPCWWSGDWGGEDYGRDYDPTRSFFEQFDELRRAVPFSALMSDYASNVRSDYTNETGNIKDCYLLFDAGNDENVLYGQTVVNSRDSMDAFVLAESELCYEMVMASASSRCFFLEDSSGCVDVLFSRDCIGCTNCFGCCGLRKQKYCIFNVPHTKEDYERKMAEHKLDTWSGVQRARREVDTFFLTRPHRYIHASYNTEPVSGDYVYASKNARDMYMSRFCEDSRYCQFITMKSVRDSYDYTLWGDNAQRIYESLVVGEGADSVRFCFACWKLGTMDLEYCQYAVASSHLFGCVGLKKKQYCILNQQYTPEEYTRLREIIVADMRARGEYGEFFPAALSPFGYNESMAQEYFPLDKVEASRRGWNWHNAKRTEYRITKKAADLPDSINDVNDDIVNEIIECPKCAKAYRLVSAELELLRRFKLPLPRMCPDCRHASRVARTTPPALYPRKCAKCGIDISSAYSPVRPEIVYCERCYQQEVL